MRPSENLWRHSVFQTAFNIIEQIHFKSGPSPQTKARYGDVMRTGLKSIRCIQHSFCLTGSLMCGFAALGCCGSGSKPSSRCCCSLNKLLQSPDLYHSGPSNSHGCWMRSQPFPHCRSSAEQYLSQPQQIRSGCLG